MPDRPLLLVLAASLLAACASHAPTPAERTTRPRDPRQALQIASRAQAAAEDGRTDDAIRLYNEALLHDDSLAFAWNNLGLELMERQAYQDAVLSFTRAADLTPSDPRPMTNAGIAFHRAGFDREALRHFEYALERDPNWLEALRGAGRAARRLYLSDDRALERVRHALLIEPDDRWRSFFERERIRIEQAQRAAEEQ